MQISPASVEGLVKQTAGALDDPYTELLAALDDSPVRQRHRPRQTDLPALAADLKPHRDRISELLAQGARSRDPKTKRFCAGLRTHEPALWTFPRLPGVSPTNNASERALRHAVIWRKTSYGTQTEHGDRLVERLLTIRETCTYNNAASTRDW